MDKVIGLLFGNSLAQLLVLNWQAGHLMILRRIPCCQSISFSQSCKPAARQREMSCLYTTRLDPAPSAAKLMFSIRSIGPTNKKALRRLTPPSELHSENKNILQVPASAAVRDSINNRHQLRQKILPDWWRHNHPIHFDTG